MIDIGLLHQLQELARIGRQRFHIAALAFGIDGVEGKAGLARTGQAGDDDQPVARQIKVDALEIVLARAANGNVSQHERSEEHTSELQSLMRISYAVFCLKKTKDIYTQ